MPTTGDPRPLAIIQRALHPTADRCTTPGSVLELRERRLRVRIVPLIQRAAALQTDRHPAVKEEPVPSRPRSEDYHPARHHEGQMPELGAPCTSPSQDHERHK